MWKNYLLVAYRSFVRQRGYSLINLLGLATGLACTLLITLWVLDERNYDRFHVNSERLYRVMSHLEFEEGEIVTWQSSPQRLADLIDSEVPEVEQSILISWDLELLFTHGEQSIMGKGFFASEAFFQVLSFDLLLGDTASVLAEPTRVAISASLAQQLFGADWRTSGQVLGTTLKVNQQKSYTIGGVYADPPAQSSIQCEFVLPLADMLAQMPWQRQWGNYNFSLLLLLSPEVRDTDGLGKKITDLAHQEVDWLANFSLQRYTDKHLYGEFENGRPVGGRILYVRIFSVVAVFLLLIACINFMNLATARAGKRAREVGVRKAAGATRRALMAQFFTESLLMAFLALFLALAATQAVLPAFNELTGKSLALSLAQPAVWLALVGTAVLTGLVSGSYPALLLASLPIVNVLKGTLRASRANVLVRRGLVISQFTLSIALISSTLVIYQQLSYIRTKNMGIDREQIIRFRLPDYNAQRYEQLRQRLVQAPGVVHVSSSDQSLIDVSNSTTSVDWPGRNPDSEEIFHAVKVNYDFVETYRIQLAQGRSFSRDFGTDTAAYLLNETALRLMGWQDSAVLGKPFSLWGLDGTVIGVMKDFHITSFRTAIEPVVFTFQPTNTSLISVRLAAGEVASGLAAAESAFRAVAPGFPFQYTFLDDDYGQMYRSEVVMGVLARWAAGIGVLIACLGLLGLAAFIAEQRTKEISIRKVLGASVPQLVALLSREFTLLVLLAFVLAMLPAYLLLDNWLAAFAYRIEMPLGVFVLAGLLALFIAWLTIAYQAFRSATANPADVLRTD
ncbi:MAG: ABC transporter permease [Bacteroidia bacterium]